MSKVKQFHLREGTLVEGKSLGCLNVYLASDYDQLKEKLAVTTDCADAYSRMFEEVSEDRERVMAERDTLRKQLDEARELLADAVEWNWLDEDAPSRESIDAWLEAHGDE